MMNQFECNWSQYVSPVSAEHTQGKSQAYVDSELADLSKIMRIGLRGSDTESLLLQHGFDVPCAVNKCVDAGFNLVLLRVAKTEFWLCSLLPETTSEQEGVLARLIDAAASAESCHLLPLQHSHALFSMPREAIEITMSKLCAVNLAPHAFNAGMLVQTSLAKVSAVIALPTSEKSEQVLVLCDSAYAEYLWLVLCQARSS